ncbi:MAG: YggS family pyridoxal phosphate-dependent enzyme [Jatrophihabitantaceae bacterium]
MSSSPEDDRRRSDLVTALGAVRHRIADVCGSVGRDPHQVTLIVVTKTYPARDVVTLAQLGVRDVGESRDQEAVEKLAQVDARLRGLSEQLAPLRWHFVGRVQSRKCRSIAQYASAVHSLDRAEIADRLAAAITESRRPPLEVFLQISLDGDPGRGGVVASDALALGDAVAAHSALRLRGVMAVAPIGADPDRAFADLHEVSDRLRAAHPAAEAISAGMSGDLDAALRHGATHVRVGSALLGRRAPVIG